MVFKSVVVNLVNTYLGKYVKDLDSSNLDLSLWRGDVILNNLTLKEDALADLDLPVEVKCGYIGKLSAKIPWSNIYTQPVVVAIEDVFVLASPVTEIDYDAEHAEERLIATKRRKLQAIEKSNKASSDEKSQESGLSDSYTFVEKLTAQIIKNVQVFIKNIHIRYEDKLTVPGSSFAVGITLKHLTAETTDEFWKPCVVNATERKIFKLVSLDSLAVYWNTEISSNHYGRSQDWQSLLRSDIKTKATKTDDYEYVLEPFSFEAHMQIDQNSAITNNKPMFSVKVVQQDMILSLSKSQFHNLMNLIESFELMIANEPYRKYRPNVPLHNNANIWWKYAFTAIVHENIRTWSWENIRRHRSLYHEYKNVYKRKLLCEQRGIETDLTLKSKLRDIEDKLELSSILIAREHANAEFKADPSIPEDCESKESTSGWWGWLFGSNEVQHEELSSDFDLSTSISLSALSPAEKQRLYDALDYSESVEGNQDYPKEYVKYELLFSMENFEVRLMDELRRNLSFVTMRRVSGSVNHRPWTSNTSVNLGVTDINIYGHQSHLHDDAVPKLLYLQTSGKDTDLVFFEFSFDLNPIHVPADYSVFLKMEAVKIVHDTSTVMQFVNFFKMPESRALQELAEVASSGLIELQNRTRAGLEYAVSQQTVVCFDVNLKSPCFVVPEYGAMERPGSVFVVDFGHLTIKSDLNSKKTLIQDATESDLENMLSDNFDVTLSDMQVLIADKGDDWLTAHAQSCTPYHLLPSSRINLEILRNANSSYSSLPEIRIKGVLPQLEIRLSENKYQQVMQFISNLPLLTEPLDEAGKDDRFLTKYPVNLSRHSSRLSLEEAADIQHTIREALAISSACNDDEEEDEFQDAEDKFFDDDDEDEWILASDSLSEVNQDSPSSEVEEVSRANKVTVSGDFSVRKVAVVFNKLQQTVDQTYICLEVNELNGTLSLTEYVMDISAKLGSVRLIDYFFQDINGGPLTILSSVAEKELISIFYRKVDPVCPNFTSCFNEVQFLIKTEFNLLNVLLHREGITTFQNFILALVERSEKPNLRKLGERVTSYLEVIPENAPLEFVNLDDGKENEKSSTYVGKTSIGTTLDDLRVTLSANNEYFALLEVGGLHVDVLLEDKQTHIEARLECCSVENLNTNTLHKKVLEVEDDNLCDFEATLYSKKTRTIPTSADLNVCCQFGRLKYVFLQNFMSQLQEFFSAFAGTETRRYAQDATTEAVQIQVEHLQKASPKVVLTVDINAPIIKIPLNSLSDDGVIVDLGSLVIRNNLVYQKGENNDGGKNGVLLDKINITLECFNVIRFDSAFSWSAAQNLVDPTGLSIALTRCLEGYCDGIPSIEVDVVLRHLTTSVDESDFRLLMGIWIENIQHIIVQQKDKNGSTEEISHMPEVEQHLIEGVDGQVRKSKKSDSHGNDMKISAVIDYVSLQFPRPIDNKRLPNLELNVQKLKAAFSLSDCTTFGTASLGDLFLTDYNSIGNLMKPYSVLESSREKDLISVEYSQNISQSVPSKTSQSLKVLSTVFKLHFEEQSILRIQLLCKSFYDSFELLKSPTTFGNVTQPDKEDTTNLRTYSNEDDRYKSNNEKIEDGQPKSNDDMKLTVNLDRLEVTLSRKETPIIKAVIEDVFTEVVVDSEKFVVISRQKGLSVTDLNPFSKYPNVVEIEGEKLFDFEYQTLSSTSASCTATNRKKSLTSIQSLLFLGIGKIRFVFLYKLLSDIQIFFQTLVSPETTSYSYELVQKTVQEQLESVEAHGTRIGLKISIQAPIIVLPNHSQSVDCLVADLGRMTVKNEFALFSHVGDASQEVVVDKIYFDLQSVQLSRGTVDFSTHTIHRRVLVKPLKMNVALSRSMQASAHWLPYLSIDMSLEHVEMNMDETDYQLLVNAMQENYAEADDIFTSTSGLSGDVFVTGPVERNVVDNIDASKGAVSEDTTQAEETEIWDTTVATFTFSGLSLSLYNDETTSTLSNDSLQQHSKERTLCTCELQESNGKIIMRSDSSIDLHLYLFGCIVEDARQSKLTAFPRMLSHKTEQKHGKRCSLRVNAKRPSMIDVSYAQTPNGEMHVELILQDPVLYISFPLVWSLLDFFAANSDVEDGFNNAGTTLSQSTMNNVSPSQSTTPYVLNVNGALKNPEIVLLGEPENPCSSALIVQTSIEFEYKLIDNRQNFSTTSTGLMVHSCRYPDRQKTLYKVVKPCAINFRYSYPGTDCEGQEIRLCVPEMKIKVSPLLLKTLLAIYASFYGDQQTNEEDTSEPVSNTEENNEFWKPRPVCKENRYQEQARVPSRIHLNTAVMEKFSLEIKSVRLTLYNEVMAHRVPLLLVNCTIVSNVQDWSSELKLATDLSMEAWYYNETFAAWEPLIESEESLNGRHLWQLELKVFKGESHILLFSPDSEEQKLIEEEDFESLTSLPVTGNSRHGFRQQSPLRSSISEVDGEEQNPNLDEGQAPMVIDEVDNCAPRSPFLSVSSDIIPQATYIVLSSDDIMQLTVTRPAVDVLTHISEIFTKVTSAAPSETTLPESPFAVINDLGIHTSVSLGYRHETTQGSTPELSITRRDRKGVSEQTNNDQDTFKSYPAELYMLDPSSHRIPSSKSSKDDSVIYQKHDVHDCSEEDDTNNAEDENDFGIEIVKAPAGKRFIRSISLPAKDMRSKMKVADQKGRQDKSDINIVVEKEPVVDHNQSITSLPENEISIHHDQLDSKKISNIDFPVGIKPGKKHKSNRSFEKRKGLHLGSINEDIMEDEKKESEFNKVQTNTSEESKEPSFISGAFATMGLIAGISGHPVSGAERLIDKHAEESKAVLFERPEYKKANDYISIKVDGFEELPFVLVTRAGRFLYQLRPKKHGRHFYIVVQIAIKHGQKRVTIRSPLQVKNNMDIAIDLIQSGTVRINTSADYPSASKKDQTISTIQPKEVGNLPLFCAHKGNFFIRPCADGFMKSTTSVSWEHFSGNNQANILTCFPEENGPKYTFCVKVHCEPDSLNTTPSRMAPHHILHLHPTISFGNFLPFSLTLKLKESNTHIMVIEPSKRHQLTCVTTNKESEFSLKVEQYMGASWCGVFKLGGDGQRTHLVEMEPNQVVHNKLYFRLEYVQKGGLLVNFYSAYWIVNRTNRNITYKPTKSSNSTYKQLESDIEPLLYESSSNKKKIMLKIDGCDWSKKFSLDAVGNAGDLVCEEKKSSRKYEMVITIELSSNTLTKIITIMPKYVIINKTECAFSLCEKDLKNELWIPVKPNQCVPFWPVTKSNAFLVKLEESILTSKVIRMDSLFPATFRVGHGVLMEMNTEITESSNTIVFTQATARNLPKLENYCKDTSILLHQKNAGTTTVLSPLTSIVYLWDEPGGDLTLLWQPENFDVNPKELPLNKDGFGMVKQPNKRRKTSSVSSSIGCMGKRSSKRSSESVRPTDPEGSRLRIESVSNAEKTIYWMSFLDGFQRVVIFTDDPIRAQETRKHCQGEPVTTEIFLSLDGVRLSVVNQQQTEVVHLGISSATSIWEVEKSPEKWKILNVETSSLLEEAWRNDIRTKKLDKDVEVDFDTMTLIKPYRGSLNRRYEPGLWVHYSSSINYENLSAKVHRIQIDNQIFGTIFPCALYPAPLPTYITQRYGFKPFFEVSALYRNDSTHNFLHLRYFKILMQEMNIKLEKEFLHAIYRLLYGDFSDEDDEEMLFQQHLRNVSLTLEDILNKSGSLDTRRMFLEEFHLSPLKANLSLSLRSSIYQSEKQSDSDLFHVFVDSVGSPLTEVNDVLIKLACFERVGLFTTQSSLASSATKHYTWQALQQFHAIALGLDVLGNPYGLLTDIGEGVKDLFYEPYQGIVLGPHEFATGLARGVKSLLGHAIGGTAGAMSKITGTFGQAFASLSFDQDYRMKRRLRMANGPSSVQEGVAKGGKSFLMGLVFGVSGVVTKPYQGARADGVEGFFKGFGKGILGLVTRPTVGVFDMVSTTLDGIRRSAEQDGKDVVVRMRLPRFSPPDAPLRPYADYQAKGNAILKSLPRAKEIICDVYADHTPIPKDGHSSIAIFTDMRFIEVHQAMFWSEWKVNVDVLYEDISDNVRLSEGAIEICIKNNDRITIESTDYSTLQIVQKKLEEQLYHYKATK